MFNYAKKKILFTLLATSLFGGQLSAAALTDTQLHAVMGIITNFILSDTDTTAPVFTSSATVSVSENQTDAIVLSTTDASGVTYSLSGTDAAFFTVGASTGVVTFNTAPDYETRTSYTFTVTATDSAGNSANQEVTLSIIDYTNPFQIAKIQGSDSYNSEFGTAVSSSGNYVVVGVPLEKNYQGVVYLYEIQSDNSLLEIAKIEADDAQAADEFGTSVAIDGDYIVVGAARKDVNGDNSAGAAYVFKRETNNTISQIAQVNSSNPVGVGYFGSAVSIDGDYIVVGATNEHNTENNITVNRTGSAYVFKRYSDTNVTEIARIVSSDIDRYNYFGSSVSIDGDYIVVGAYGNDIEETEAGSTYVFKRYSDTNVTEIAILHADDAEPRDHFGISVSISNDYIVVGAHDEDTQGSNAGSAYLFKRNSDTNVTQIAKINANDTEPNDAFGFSVSMSEDIIVIGANLEDTNGTSAGSAYIFKRESDDTITQIAKIQGHDSASYDEYGTSVYVSGRYLVVGAPFSDGDKGSAYVHDLEAQGSYVYNAPSSFIAHAEAFKSTEVYTLDVGSSSGGTTSYTISGDDGSSFFMTGNTLYYTEPADFEMPTDSDVDNNYSLNIALLDEDGTSRSIDIEVVVEDKNYLLLDHVVASDAANEDQLGGSVAVSGNYTVVGAAGDYSLAEAVYVYEKQADDSMMQIAKLVASDASTNADFGKSVAIDGNYIVVGAKTSAYVFKIDSSSSITEIAKIQSDDIIASDKFGVSVSMSAGYIAVGATHQDTNGADAGSVYVFKVVDDTNITQIAKIQSDDIEAGDLFGQSVSMSGEYITIGAQSEDGNATDKGSAYVFRIVSDTNVTQIAKLTASDAQNNDLFGYSVSMSGDNIVVGAYLEDTGANNAGSAYVFKRYSDTNVTQIAKIQAHNPESSDYFGKAVAISGTTIVVGAHFEDTGGSEAGSVYVFEIISDTNVTQVQKVQAYDLEVDDRFGNAVAIDAGTIAVGSHFDAAPEIRSGSVYIFMKDDNQP